MDSLSDIKLARDGEITWDTHKRLGYDRLSRGVYGHLPATVCKSQWEARRELFLCKVQGVLAPYAGRPVVLFGPTALQVLGVALPSRLQDWDNVHLMVERGSYRPARSGVISHTTTMPISVWRQINGGPLPNPVDAWVQLDATENELVEVGDGLVRRQQPLLKMTGIATRLAELTGTPGVKMARRAFRLVVPGTDSIMESRTRLVLVRAGLPCPSVNHPVPCRNAGWVYHVDMGYVKEKTAVEFDGAVHVENTEQMEIDAQRRRDIQDEGWLIITVTKQQLKYPAQFVHSVETALIMRRSELARRRRLP